MDFVFWPTGQREIVVSARRHVAHRLPTLDDLQRVIDDLLQVAAGENIDVGRRRARHLQQGGLLHVP